MRKLHYSARHLFGQLDFVMPTRALGIAFAPVILDELLLALQRVYVAVDGSDKDTNSQSISNVGCKIFNGSPFSFQFTRTLLAKK